MVRKHYAWTRARQKRSRPKTPAPKTGWLIAELSQISGVPVRRLRDYVFRDLIQPLERRGTATRYQRGQLVRLLAIKRMRAETDLKLAEIKTRLDAMGERELEAWLLTGPLPANVREALGHSPAKAASASATGGIQDIAHDLGRRAGSGSDGTEPAFGLNRTLAAWYHVELLPGLVLHLSASASPAVRSAAKRICDEYVGG